MPVCIPAIIEKMAKLDVNKAREFRDLYTEKYDEEVAVLERRSEEGDGSEFYADQHYVLTELMNIAHEMAIVVLYRVVELNSLVAARWRWKNAENKRIYKSDVLAGALKNELRTDIATIPHFKTIDELRCANNAIKHNGVVSSALAVFPGWVKGDKMVNLNELFDRAAKIIPSYIRALAEIIVPRQIHVRLMNEDTQVWRAVDAQPIRRDCYKITATLTQKDEEWEFSPGMTVMCEMRTFKDGTTGLAAVSKVS